MHVDKEPSPAYFHSIINVFDLKFKGQRFESNTLVSAYVKSVFIGITDDTNAHDVKGCQDSRSQDMSRGVAYSLILSKMQHIAFSPMLFIRMWPCVCACMCLCIVCVRPFECLIGGPHKNDFK